MGKKKVDKSHKLYALVKFITSECLCVIQSVLSVTDFIQAACSCGLVYLTTFPVHLLYYVFYCIGVCSAWVGVILPVYASVGVR